jgi:hypothetical protein
LWPDLADQVPLASDQLHAVCHPLAGGGLLVCALPLAELDAIDGAAAALYPDAIPDELADGTVGPAGLNLLVGRYEPLPIRRARARSWAVAGALVLALLGLVMIGAWRRAAHDHLAARQARAAGDALLAAVGLPNSSPKQLQVEVDRLRLLAGVDLDQKRPRDAAAGLQALLSAWPASTAASPQSINIGQDGALLAVLVPGDDAGDFIKALHPPPGWRLEEPSLVKVDTQTRVNLRMRPEARGAHP